MGGQSIEHVVGNERFDCQESLLLAEVLQLGLAAARVQLPR